MGAAVAASLSKAGFSVAVVSRKATEGTTPEGYTSIQGDLSDPTSVPTIFSKVTSTLGTPRVVIYNAATLTPPPDQDSVLSIPATSLSGDLNTNTVTPYAAAQEAVKGFASLPAGANPVFIYTGNALNNLPLPVALMTTLGVGKSATAYWVAVADQLYTGKGYRYVISNILPTLNEYCLLNLLIASSMPISERRMEIWQGWILMRKHTPISIRSLQRGRQRMSRGLLHSPRARAM